MELGHDTVAALAVVADLVNTAADGEGLGDLSALEAFVAGHHLSEVAPLAEPDLDDVRRVRDRLRSVWDAPDGDAAVARVNALVADARTTPRLAAHDGWPLHMHYFAPGARLAEHLAADGGMALAFVLAAGERDRLRACAAPGCARVLVDLSRNRSRRYCDSRTCGNRLHVAAYRARRAGAG